MPLFSVSTPRSVRPQPLVPLPPPPPPPMVVVWTRVPASRPPSSPVRLPPRRTLVSLPQRTSSRDRTSLSPVPRLASPRLSVVLSATPTSRFARIPPTPRTPSCGTTPPLSPTPCSVDCALKDLTIIRYNNVFCS